MMLDSDRRQLAQMADIVRSARAGCITLLDAANSLLFLRDAISDLNQSWSDRFTSQIATLESAGTATAEQRELMGGGYELVVRNALDEAQRMIEAAQATL